MRVARPADGVLAMKSKSFLVNARRCALERGFSLVELMVTVAVLSLLMTLAVPSFNEWIQNGRIRTAAESIQSFDPDSSWTAIVPPAEEPAT